MKLLKTLAAASAIAALLLSSGCNPQAKHPNQINTFDGASYDSLTLAHAALSSLRTSIPQDNPRFVETFNQAVNSYSVAYQAYALFRAIPGNQASAALTLSNLTVGIIFLENTLESSMNVAPRAIAQMHVRAAKARAAASPRINISDILSELQIAAALAASVPGTQPYAGLAQVVIKATQEAVVALEKNSGSPIDLTTIQPLEAISSTAAAN